MSKLAEELQRLYGFPTPVSAINQAQSITSRDASSAEPRNGSSTGRLMILSVRNGGHWPAISALYQGVQTDWGLPAPALAISPKDGYQVWFSFAEAQLPSHLDGLLLALCDQYLADVAPATISIWPSLDTSLQPIPTVPAYHEPFGKWSAFIDPSMVEFFAEDMGLELSPMSDQQADFLSGLTPIASLELQRVIAAMADAQRSSQNRMHSTETSESGDTAGQPSGMASTTNERFTDPRLFLLAVMNDPAVGIRERIEAAKALLPMSRNERV